MIKAYEVIKVNDFGIIIDGSGKCDVIGALAFARQYDVVSPITEALNGSCRDIILAEMPHRGTFDYRQLDRVIATLGRRFQDVPFIDTSREILKYLTAVEVEVKELYERADYDDADGPTGYALIIQDIETLTITPLNLIYS